MYLETERCSNIGRSLLKELKHNVDVVFGIWCGRDPFEDTGEVLTERLSHFNLSVNDNAHLKKFQNNKPAH